MALFEGSRYEYVGIYEREGIPTIRTRILDHTSPDNSRYYTIVEGDTIDYLSYRFYGDPQYWWILADANLIIEDFFTDLPKGTQIIVPPLRTKLRQSAGG